MSRPFKLYRLQQIDSQLDWTKKRLREIEAALKEDEALRQASANAQQADEALVNARKALRRAEDQVSQQRVKIEQSEAALYGGKVRNPKELQDLENEVAALKRYLDVLEDRQLEAMLVEEEALSEQRVAAGKLEEQRAQFDQRSKELLVEKEGLLKDIDRFMGERQAAASSISSQDMDIYTQLRKQRRGIAVAKVTDKACSACGTTLSAALLHAARSPDHINRCDTCSRILYAG
jgi:predicted  nucleic acid-binding Zn-ribbon protein